MTRYKQSSKADLTLASAGGRVPRADAPRRPGKGVPKSNLGSRAAGSVLRSRPVDSSRENDHSGRKRCLAAEAIGPDSAEPPRDSPLRDVACDIAQLTSIVACDEDGPLCAPCQILYAQEAERKRIAAELHDGLGQWLGLIKFELEQARDRLTANAPAEAAATLDALAPKISGAMDEVRRIAMNLRPSTLEDLGILATLSWFLREYGLVYRAIEVAQAIEVREGDIPEALKLPLYRIIQEALNNTAKHAGATRVAVRLWRQGDVVRLVVEDNGVGFDPANAYARGLRATLGHAGMRDRVRLTGGTFDIETARGAGVKIMATWNLGHAVFGADPSPYGVASPLG